MSAKSDTLNRSLGYGILGYGIIIAGLVLSFISAVVPFYSSGYKLLGGVLFMGMLPYVIYGLAVVLLRNTLTVVVGVVLFAIHLWLVVGTRFIENADYSNGLIYYVPLVLALVLSPLLVMALRAPWHK